MSRFVLGRHFGLGNGALNRSTRTPSASALAKFYSVASPTGTDSNYLEDMYFKWKADPSSVNSSLQRYFRDIESGHPSTVDVNVQRSGSSSSVASSAGQADGLSDLKTRAIEFVRAYQVRGHNAAMLDPLGLDESRKPVTSIKELNPASYNFTDSELQTNLNLHSDQVAGYLGNAYPNASLRQLIDRVQETYANSIGYEYMHIPDRVECNWLRERIETASAFAYSKEQKVSILERLVFADQFEHFLSIKYPNQKRFGIEGGESFILSMKAVIDASADHGVSNFVMGMAHRGRLNVLGNVVRKPLGDIFADFQGRSFDESSTEGSGDVKYHLGMSRERTLRNGKKVRISILANPSHLEAVNPVVLGKTRAKQYYLGDKTRDQTLSMLVHGDAAFSGQGIVYETMELNGLHGYTVGGTVHFIINNQIGFTTDPKSLRSSPYCSDVAKGFNVPIFHVNGDDPEAVQFVSTLAADWRKKFKKDVVLDIVCYRRRGHNEGDTPLFTQPLMYNKIDKHPSTMEIYAQKLINEGVITAADYEKLKGDVNKIYADAFLTIPEYQKSLKRDWLDSYWANFKGNRQLARIKDTGVRIDLLQKVGKAVSTYPSDFNIHRNLAKIFQQKLHSVNSGEDIDWATAEGLAFGTLLLEGNHVRLSGQDVVRGTFSHRHASVFDQKTGEPYTFLEHLEGRAADFHVHNSNLSEFGVLGFELGYSMENPNALVLWEAQFGDFANGAQVMIDQFVSSGENKWLRQSGLVMLLPHGYDGGGPEHSSARLERYLQLCSDDPTKPGGEFEHQEANWAVVNITSAANYYHALRRQVHREFRKPLIVMSPKSLLRFKGACSKIEEMGPQNLFRRLIPETETDLVSGDKVRRVIFCSGKVYFDLLKRRQMLADQGHAKDVALIRVEQICPFPYALVAQEFAKYPRAELAWCQEEPQNMGAWFYVSPRFETALNNDIRPRYLGRAPSASPATGWLSKHEKELESFLHNAFAK